MGPSIATKIILDSGLNLTFRLIHQETKINKSFDTMGKINLLKTITLISQYFIFSLKCLLFKPDLVVIPISQSYKGFMKDAFFIKLANIFRLKSILYLRGSNFLNMYNSLCLEKQRKINSIISGVQGVIIQGEKMRPVFRPFLPDNKIYVVPNGSNYQFNKLSQPQIPRIIYLGNLQPSKGILDVIQSYIMIRKKVDVELHIVGQWRDFTTRDIILNKIEEEAIPCKEITDISLNLSSLKAGTSSDSGICFYTSLNGQLKLDLLASSDIFIFPPREPEGHPWVIIEAMAAGLPVITTDQGAITESVSDGINGFIVNTQDPQQIASKIQYLIENPEVRNQMGKEGRRIYEERFTEEKLVENLANVFNKVINQNKEQ